MSKKLLNFGAKKLYKQGGSLMVVIPDVWVKLNGVKLGDKVDVTLGLDNELIIRDIEK